MADAQQNQLNKSNLQAPLDWTARIPPEIAGYIFILCRPDSRWTSPNQCYAPLVVTHVCGSWRRLAHGTPELWSALALFDLPYDHWGYQDLIGQWLLRSGALPLTVTFSNYDNDTRRSRYSEEVVARRSCDVLEVVVPHAHRIRDLTVDLLAQCYISDTWDRMRQTMTAVRTAFISATGTAVNAPYQVVAEDMPHLHSLQYTSQVSNSILPYIKWNQLTRLTIDLANPLELLEILPQCIAIENLDLNVSDTICVWLKQWEDAFGTPEYPKLALPNVKYLRLGGHNSPIIMPSCTFRGMKSLEVCQFHDRDGTFIGAFISFAQRCGAGVVKLTIKSDMNGSHIIEILRPMPMLEQLSIDLRSVDDHLLRFLTIRQTEAASHVVAPHLKRLYIHQHIFGSLKVVYHEYCLLAMLRSRTKQSLNSYPPYADGAVHCLETVDLEIGHNVTSLIFKKEELRSAGLIVNIVTDGNVIRERRWETYFA